MTGEDQGFRPETDAPLDAHGRKGRLRLWASRKRLPLGLVVAVLCAALAVLWMLVVPERANETTGMQQLMIRWGHPLCWALFSLGALVTALGGPKRLRDIAVWCAGVSYAAFLGGLAL